ncbi:hypothetical protein [Streptacidiphilus sp. MAP5-52]|uniref:hypothetical protein n=1 Tax=Streptacidiphilus sp. MAP5-52 TaxID=3156267 RepID=UPI003514E5DB
MLIPLAAARQLVADELPEQVLRLAPDAIHPQWLRDTGHFFLGAHPVRGHKQSGQWHADRLDLADAIARLSSVARSAGPLVPADLPWTGLEGDLDNWRLTVQGELVRRAAAARQRKRAVDLLDTGLDPDVRRSAGKAIDRALDSLRGKPQRPEPATIAGIAVLDLMASAPLSGGELADLVGPELAHLIAPGLSQAQSALLAVASVPGITTVLLSASSAPHWDEAQAALAGLPLTAAQLRDVTDALSTT